MVISISSDDVLIVEDDTAVADVYHMYLEDLHLFRNIIWCKDGADATVKLNNQKFTIIILDYNLPKKNGLEIIQHLRDSKPDQLRKVVFISGQLDKEVLQQALSLGVKHVLVKPFDKNMFVERINQLLTAK